MSTTKLSKEELQQLKDFQRIENEITFSLGDIEKRKYFLSRQKEKLENDYVALLNKQETVGKELQEKYGEGNIDLDPGEITLVK